MAWTRVGVGVAGAAAIVSALLATLTIWLLVTEPTTMAAAFDSGSAAAVARVLGAALVDVFRLLMSYL